MSPFARRRVAIPDPASIHRTGFIYAVTAYALWGFFPLYFLILAPANAFEIVAWRVVFSFVLCAVLLMVTRTWRKCWSLLTEPRTLFLLAIAGILIFGNWQTYVLGTLDGEVVDVSLGYFINPILTVFLGVVVLRERLRRLQWVSVALGVIAVVIVTIGQGQLPFIALGLALTFSFYGLIKKRVGTHVDALSGLVLETLFVLPIAVGELVIVAALGALTFGDAPVHTLLLVGTGVVTAVPLLFFGAAARRLPLAYLGFIQYGTPVIQFLLGIFLLGESLPSEQWIGFIFVWMAIVLIIVDAALARRAGRAGTPEAEVV